MGGPSTDASIESQNPAFYFPSELPPKLAKPASEPLHLPGARNPNLTPERTAVPRRKEGHITIILLILILITIFVTVTIINIVIVTTMIISEKPSKVEVRPRRP